MLAERAALLSGWDEDFTMIVTIGYTGLRWGEAIGLERGYVRQGELHVEWQLRELNGRFHRLPPKDDSYRSRSWDPGFCPSTCPHSSTSCSPARSTTTRTGDNGQDASYSPPSGRGIQSIPDDTPLACWLPVRAGLTPHGLRQSHKTWMAEDGIPEILAE